METIETLTELLDKATEPLNVFQIKQSDRVLTFAIATDKFNGDLLQMQCSLINAYVLQQFGSPAQQAKAALALRDHCNGRGFFENILCERCSDNGVLPSKEAIADE